MVEGGFHLDIHLKRGRRSQRFNLQTDASRLGVKGPSGAGKTTLIRILGGLEESATGVVTVGGMHLQGGGLFVPPWERQVGWVPQEPTLFPHASVLENLTWGGGDALMAKTMAESLGIAHLLARRPRHLSGGEAQRVAIGRAILKKPQLLLLDEPFTALDPHNGELAKGVIQAYLSQAPGAHLLLVSHQLGDLEALCEEVWSLDEAGAISRT